MLSFQKLLKGQQISEDDLKNPKDEDKKKNGKKNDKQNV